MFCHFYVYLEIILDAAMMLDSCPYFNVRNTQNCRRYYAAIALRESGVSCVTYAHRSSKEVGHD